MNERVIGIDLGLKHKHRASVWDSSSKSFLGKSFRVDRTYDDFELLVQRSQQNAEVDTRFVFVLEPTSMAWLPLSCFLIAQGYTVYLVNPQKVSALRKFFGLNKSDRLDAETLARTYLIKPDSLHSLYLPKSTTKSIDRFCRQRAKLVKRVSAIKKRIWHTFTFVSPKALEAFHQYKFSKLGRAFLRNLISPYKIVDLGLDGLTDFLSQNCQGTLDPEIPKKLFEASISTVQIYQGYHDKHGLPYDLDNVQLEINIELDILETYEQKIALLDKKIHELYLKVDPDKQLQTVAGIGDVIAPIIFAVVCDIKRFPNVRSFKGMLRFHPRKKQTTDHDKKGLRIVKSSFWLLKQSFYMAAEVARKWDVEFAAFYERLTNRGLHHDQAICAIANKLAGRVYAVMKRMADQDYAPEEIGYQFRNLQGEKITKKQAKEIIDNKFPGVYEKQKILERQRLQQGKQKNILKQKQKPNEAKKQSNRTDRAKKIVSMDEILKELIPQYFKLGKQ
jgi:transposase